MLVRSITRNSLVLTLFAFFTAGALAFTFANTKDKIAQQERRAAAKALLEIVPASRHDNDLLEETWLIPSSMLVELGLSEERFINIAMANQEPVAIIVPSVAPDGYSGDISMLIGINVDGTLAGVRVLSHKETPGLGDKVDLKKSNWVLGFNGLSLLTPLPEKWKVKKDGGDFDQFTGATITPRAVVNRVRKTLELYAANKGEILASYDIPNETNHRDAGNE